MVACKLDLAKPKGPSNSWAPVNNVKASLRSWIASSASSKMVMDTLFYMQYFSETCAVISADDSLLAAELVQSVAIHSTA